MAVYIFYRRKKIFLFAKELLVPRLKKKIAATVELFFPR